MTAYVGLYRVQTKLVSENYAINCPRQATYWAAPSERFLAPCHTFEWRFYNNSGSKITILDEVR
jgi:hypothetical protein